MKTSNTLLLLLGPAAALWTGLAAAQPAGPGPAGKAPVTVAPESVAVQSDTRAQLTARQYTTLAAEIGAKIEKLPIPEGGTFKAGQVLVSFDCAIQRAQLQRSEAELAAAEFTYKANAELEKLNSVGRLEVDLARTSVLRSTADVSANRATVEKCTIVAPFSGRVAEQKVREQQFVQAGQALLDVLDDSVLEVEFIVPSRWLLWLKPGGTLSVRIDETGRSYPARFTRIGARVDPVSQSVKVAAAIDGRFPELVAGMSGRISVNAPRGR
jgi:membrane fusion protein (multidrug efflux system)